MKDIPLSDYDVMSHLNKVSTAGDKVSNYLSNNITLAKTLAKLDNNLDVLVNGDSTTVKYDKNFERMTDNFNDMYTNYRDKLGRNIEKFNNPNTKDSNPYESITSEMVVGDWAGFQSIPRINGAAGLFVSPPSKVSFSQMYNFTLDAVGGTQLQFLRSYLFSSFRYYTHPNKKFEKLVKKTMNSLDWNSKFLFGLSNYLISGNSCGQLTWDYDKKTKEYYIDNCVFVPNTNLQYMVDFKGEMMGAIQPNVFANPEGLFPAIDSSGAESEFAIREFIGKQLPYMIVPKKDLFYCAYDNLFSPYGISPIRKAYQYFQNKQILLNMLMHASAKNSSPYLVASYAKNSLKDYGEIEQLREMMASLTVGNTATIPDTVTIDAIDANKGSLESLLSACQYMDAMIIRSMYGGSTGMINSSETSGSYASKSEDNEMVEKTLELHKAVADEAIRKCILTRLAEMNDYKEVYEDGEYGTFVSSEATLGQKMQITKIFETGVNSGLIDNMNEEEVNHFRRKLSLPEVKSKKELTGGTEVQKSNQRDVGQKYSHQSSKKPDNVGK